MMETDESSRDSNATPTPMEPEGDTEDDDDEDDDDDDDPVVTHPPLHLSSLSLKRGEHLVFVHLLSVNRQPPTHNNLTNTQRRPYLTQKPTVFQARVRNIKNP
jgi:hypothetical protein